MWFKGIHIDPNPGMPILIRSPFYLDSQLNTIESTVKITYLPTGTVIKVNDSPSSFLNKEKAFDKLRKLVPNFDINDVLVEQFRFA